MAALRKTPRLLAAYLIGRNRMARAARRKLIAALWVGGALTLLILIGGYIQHAHDWLRAHLLGSSAIAAVAGAAMVARRRVLKRREFTSSWLAAVPIRRGPARFESLAVETVPAMCIVAALAFVCFPLLSVWASLSGAVAMGALASYAIPAPKPLDLPPGSRYVPHKQLRRTAPIRPSLKALGLWPLRQMFAWAQPKMVARATIPIFLAMPMGTTADAAMVVIGLSATAGAIWLLGSAAISSSVKLRRWMAPLPVRNAVLLRSFLLPTLGTLAGASAGLALLCSVMGASLRAALGTGLCALGLAWFVVIAGVALRRSIASGP